jgi:hypothetical protein
MLIGVVLVVAVIYMFVPPIFENWKLGNMFRSIAAQSSALENAEAVKLYALEELQKQNYHFKPENLQVVKEGRFVQLSIEYPVAIGLPIVGPFFQLRFSQQNDNR